MAAVDGKLVRNWTGGRHFLENALPDTADQRVTKGRATQKRLWQRHQTPDQSGCWQTKLTTPTACANGSNKGRSKQSFHPQPHAGRPILWTAGPTNAEISSNACSASSRTGDASQPDMTAMRKTISLVSPSQP